MATCTSQAHVGGPRFIMKQVYLTDDAKDVYNNMRDKMECNHVAMFILNILDSEGVLKSNVVDLDPRYPLGDRQPEV